MEKFLNKLSEYHFIQTIVPGIIFTCFSKIFYDVNLITEKPIYDFIIVLIIGLIISRIGSLIVEPVLRKTKILSFYEYSKYIEASQKDSFIKNLSETNNLYRGIIAAFLLILFERFYLFLLNKIVWLNKCSYLILTIVIIVLFIVSYKKQTKYIKERIEKTLAETK